jgi:hypothetical protein
MKLINWILKFFKKLKRRYIIAKAYVKMQAAFRKQLYARQTLRKDVNEFLKDYFGIDARSKYIPKDYKNAEEVKVAVTAKFNDRMQSLNLKFTDLFS